MCKTATNQHSPNILILMVDQLTGTLFPNGPVDWLHTPNLKRLAERSVRFSHAYTASPLCTPARAAFMTGQLPSRNKVYDNAAEFSSSIPTFAHHLRRAGYQTSLVGKMHFIGADQLHGFEERLTTDIYPADFGWTPDYRKPRERIDWWYHNLSSVTQSGIAEISNQLEFDDEVTYHATRKLYDLARGHDQRPWCLTASFTHPHDPYVARREYWDQYEDCEHLLPNIAAIPYEQHDSHSQRIFAANDWQNFTITEADIRRSRRAYFANISYLDAQIGKILDTLSATRQEATILFLSDHGDMLGERGLWFKMSFFEGATRIPLLLAHPQLTPNLNPTPVSSLDITPTLCDLAGIDLTEIRPWVDGESLLPTARGEKRQNPVLIEYAAEASYAPMVSLRTERFKYNRCDLDPEQLFDLHADPHELHNLANSTEYYDTLLNMRKQSLEKWDLTQFDQEVRHSQASRWVVYEALRQGQYYSWDFQPQQNASEKYMRNHMDLNVLEDNQRFPRDE